MTPQRNHMLLVLGIVLVSLAAVTGACGIGVEPPAARPTVGSASVLASPMASASSTAPRPTQTLVLTLAPFATYTPTVVPEVRLIVLTYTTYRIAPGWVYVAGEAVNRGSAPAGYLRIAVSLLDAQGRVAATSSVNEVHIEYVPPGGKYPFLVIVSSAPTEWNQVRIQFETSLYSADQLYKPYWALSVGQVLGQPPQGARPNFGYTGTVENIGSARARMVQVTAIGYDSGGQVLDVGSVYVPFEFLNPGQNVPFQIMFKNLKTPPVHYEMLAEGHLPN